MKMLPALLGLLFASQCVWAARPSINVLNTRVNELEAENSVQQTQIDALRADVDDIQSALTQLCEQLHDPAPAFCVRRVFLSGDFDDGDIFRFGGDGSPLVGVAAADSICQSEADSAGLGGTWKAWLSDSTSSPATNFFRAGKYVDLAGVTVADGWADLTDGTLDAPINLPTNGVRLTDPDLTVWTGTAANGVASTINCFDWTTADFLQEGRVGLVNSSAIFEWSDARTPVIPERDCNVSRFFYCFEQ